VIYAYLRQTSRSSSLSEQQQSITAYAANNDFEINQEVLEYSNISLRIPDRKKFESFIDNLDEYDIVIVYDLFLLSSHVEEIVEIVNCMLSHKVDLHISKTGAIINRETKLVELLPLLDVPTKDDREKSSQLGRPKGSRSSSKFDSHRPEITAMLKEGMNVSAIARELKVRRSSLKDYINSRELREFAQEGWTDISQNTNNNQKSNAEILLICPFDKNKQHKETK